MEFYCALEFVGIHARSLQLPLASGNGSRQGQSSLKNIAERLTDFIGFAVTIGEDI
jgi:hypothetical protein